MAVGRFAAFLFWGELPFWPESHEWPTDDANQPTRFVAQFYFGDSRCIFDDLPGDLFVIFGKPAGHSSESLQYHWVQTSDEAPINAKDMPRVENEFLPRYVVLHRTFDFVNVQRVFDRYKASFQLPQIEGTKIGGVPSWIQEQPEELSGQFLCALGSILPKTGQPYPYVNHAEPIGFSEGHDRRLMTWGDAGSVYLYLQADGSVRALEQSY